MHRCIRLSSRIALCTLCAQNKNIARALRGFIPYIVSSIDYDESLPSIQCSLGRLLVRREPTLVVQGLDLLTGDVGTHVPALCFDKERIVGEIIALLMPFLLGFARRVERLDVLGSHLGDGLNDPVTLNLDAGRTVGESRRTYLCVSRSAKAD